MTKRTIRKLRYVDISAAVAQLAVTDRHAALRLFLNEMAGTAPRWRGRMKAASQKALFGRNIGRGVLIIDGEREQIRHVVSACFGTDTETTFSTSWRELIGA